MVQKTPFVIGSAESCDLRLDDPTLPAEACVIQRRDRKYHLEAMPGGSELIFDGTVFTGGEIVEHEDHTLVLGRQCLALRCSSKVLPWLGGLDGQSWLIYRPPDKSIGPFSLEALAWHLRQPEAMDGNTLVVCQGLKTMGFYAEHLLPLLAGEAPEPQTEAAPVAEDGAINTEYGEFTCPVCWLRFDRGEAMNIAVHASLRGDSLLGEAHLQRFHATRFNDRGQALDAMGIPAPELACPHCRRKLPPSFLDIPHHIFSIVGAPSSGKSYYLSVLVKQLQSALYQHFGVVFRDADPSENVLLNQMKTQLFSAATPEEALLAKTELEGAMYESLPRLGRKVALPRPFIFNLSHHEHPRQDFSVVFYDNAGEHFEPTRNSADSPGAQHIAAASGIFFLFDPLHSAEFRRRLTGVADPQLAVRRLDQQDVILAETEVRTKSLLGLDSRERIGTPLAMILGKCDTWLPLLGEAPLEPVLGAGGVDLAAIERNSARLRALLLEIAPAIVANAEAISSEVRYFALSPLGASPVEFIDSRGVKMIGPDPARLAPLAVEGPTLWVLSRIAPGLIPSQPKR